VPFAYQNVSLLDGKDGKEVGRVRATDEQISFVRALPGGLFYGGGKGVYLLDEKSAEGSKKGSTYAEANLGGEQIRVFYHWDGYQLAQSDYSAFDRNRLLWRGEPRAGRIGFADDTAVLHSYRYFFAFDTTAGRIRWAYSHPRVDVVASEDVGPTVVFVSADGDVGTIDIKNGRSRIAQKTGLKVLGATFDAEGFVGGGPADGVQESESLVGTLDQIIWDPDARFTAVKVFATSALGDLPGLEASKALLKIVRAEVGIARAVQKKASERLIDRKDKEAGPLYLEALKMHYDYLEDRHPQGVGTMAKAVAAIGLKEAVPELAAHLADHETPQPALKDLVASLASLGGPVALRALREFLLAYRSDPVFLADPAALTIAADGLIKLGGDGRRTVAYVAEEVRTLPPVAEQLKKALEAASKPNPSAAAPE
jgi:hypothetical protein